MNEPISDEKFLALWQPATDTYINLWSGNYNRLLSIAKSKDALLTQLKGEVAKRTGERDEWRKWALDAQGQSERFAQVGIKLKTDRDAALAREARMRSALEPFAHPDLSVPMSHCRRPEDIVYQRMEAVLKLGDFQKAKQALTPLPGTEGGEA